MKNVFLFLSVVHAGLFAAQIFVPSLVGPDGFISASDHQAMFILFGCLAASFVCALIGIAIARHNGSETPLAFVSGFLMMVVACLVLVDLYYTRIIAILEMSPSDKFLMGMASACLAAIVLLYALKERKPSVLVPVRF